MSQPKKRKHSPQKSSEKPAAKKLLSTREEQVLSKLCEGNTYAQVGALLFISPETVRRHAANVYKKLGVKNKTQAMIKYFMK